MPNLKDLFPGLDLQDFGSGSAQVSQWAKGDDTSLIPAEKLGSVNAIQTKLDGIEEGAEVNVNADWNSTSGDSQILNLPTDLATEGYVNTKVADLVDTAPEALDTLNELASALGDDPNFATTTSTLIGDNASDIDAVEARLDTVEAFDYVETDHTGNVSIDGNVGIGTTSPGKKIEVKSDIAYDGIQISGSSIPTLAIIDTTNNAKLVAYARDSDATIGTETNHTLTINTNNTTALTIDTSQHATFAGDVNIAGLTTSDAFRTDTTSSDFSLISRDSAGSPPLYVQSANSSTGQWIARFNYGSATANGGSNVLTVAKDNSHFLNTNVGIGTDSPDYDLDVERTATTVNNDPTIRIRNSWTTEGNNTGFSNRAAGLYSAGADSVITKIQSRFDTGFNLGEVGTATNHDFRFLTNSTERVRIDSSGNVGIGVTNPSDYYSAASDLVVGGSSHHGITIASGTARNGALHFADGITGAAEYSGYIAYSHANDSMRFAANATESMRIDASGNVGIGTISPSTKLHITQPGGSSQLTLERTGGGAGKAVLAGAAEGLIVYDDAYGPKMYVGTSGTYNGNVGIGTTSPSAPIHVVKSSHPNAILARFENPTGEALVEIKSQNDALSVLQFADSEDGNVGAIQYSHVDNSMRFKGSDLERMRIDSDGNVGIGTTSPSSNFGETTLDITESTGDASLSLKAVSNRGLEISSRAADVLIYDLHGRDMRFGIGGSEKMRINSAGNVGIGTTIPGAALHVAGPMGSNAPTGNGVLMGLWSGYGNIQLNGDSGGYIDFSTSGTDRKGRLLYDNTSNYMLFETASTERMRIDSNGNVGIGTTSPSEKLDVSGAIISTGGITGHGADRTTISQEGANGAFWQSYGADSSTYGTFTLRQASSDFSLVRTPLKIDSAGNVGIGTDSPLSQLQVGLGTNNANRSLIASLGGGSNNVQSTLSLVNTLGNDAVGNGVAVDFHVSDAYSATARIAAISENTTTATGLAFSTYTNGLLEEKLLISNSGNVGIGTTTFNATYDAKLQVTSGDNDGTGGILIQNYLPTLTLFDASGGASASQLQQDGTNMVFKNSGSERMRIDSDGNVGIGTTSPNRELHVIGQFAIDNSTSPSGGLLVSPDGNSNKVYSRTGNADNTPHPLDFISGGSTSMRIDSTGNVGIGTTSPSAKLEVNGEALLGNGTDGVKLTYSSGNSTGIIDTGYSSTGLEFRTSNVERMRIDSAGNVGIGTDSPQSPLHIYKSNSGGVGGELRLDNNNTAVANKTRILFSDAGGAGGSHDRGAIVCETEASPYMGQLQFQTGIGSISTKMLITGTGNVGIGTTSPDAKLDVDGEIKSTSATISGTVAFNSLKDTAENITIAKFVDEVDGLANNDNDTTIPTSAAVVDHVDIEIKDKRQDSYKVIGLAMDYMSRVHNDGGVVEGMEQVMKNTEKLILS